MPEYLAAIYNKARDLVDLCYSSYKESATVENCFFSMLACKYVFVGINELKIV